MRILTVKAPVNIAVIKYWGKSDSKLIIPLNDSISGTLSTDDLYALTSVAVSQEFESDRMWLNGAEVSIQDNQRLVNCLNQIRASSPSDDRHHSIHICSQNNFPTAAGLASSAAGYACLVFALGNLFGIEDRRQLSILARMGSGSAIRSIYGGFVQWVTGTDSDTSISQQIVNHNYWPQVKILILVVNDKKKETGSTVGMQQSVETSLLMQTRVDQVVPQRIHGITSAILERDFHRFAEITMQDSNQFHAICQDTWPPIRYMTDISWEIIRLVQSFNSYLGSNKVAYTFDAGPNACIYLLDEVLPTFYTLVNRFFPPSTESDYIRGQQPPPTVPFSTGLLEFMVKGGNGVHPQALQYIINTSIGDGPQILSTNESLLDLNGSPKNQ